MSLIYLDTEFTGLHQKTTLISIGLVSDCGKTFYAELTDYDKLQIDVWLQENVLNNLILNDRPVNSLKVLNHHTTFRGTTNELKYHLGKWLKRFGQVEIWSDCLSYDWILFINIFGNAFDVPKNVLYIPFDICTLFKDKGIDPDISREEYSQVKNMKKHNALDDAFIIKACHRKLVTK